MAVWRDLLVFLAPWIFVPAVPLAFVPRGFRLMVLVLALIFGFGIGYVMDLGGPDSPGLLLPFFGFAVALGAVVAEGMAWVLRRIRKRIAAR